MALRSKSWSLDTGPKVNSIFLSAWPFLRSWLCAACVLMEQLLHAVGEQQGRDRPSAAAIQQNGAPFDGLLNRMRSGLLISRHYQRDPRSANGSDGVSAEYFQATSHDCGRDRCSAPDGLEIHCGDADSFFRPVCCRYALWASGRKAMRGQF